MLTLPGSLIEHSVQLEATVLLASDDIQDYALTSTVRTPSTFTEFVERLDALQLWSKAESDEEIKYAILTRATSIRKTAGCKNPEANCDLFSIGRTFRETLAAWQAGGNSKFSSTTFETCARLVAKKPKEACNMFGQSRASDLAVSYRTHVTKDHEALRLMYWKLPDGSIELACVGSKHELEIPA